MVASMTAFARKQKEFDWGTMSWEIRSVNHRFLEPSIRVPDSLRIVEPVVRDLLRKRFTRGKIDIQLRVQGKADQGSSQAINTDLVNKLNLMSQQVLALCPGA